MNDGLSSYGGRKVAAWSASGCLFFFFQTCVVAAAVVAVVVAAVVVVVVVVFALCFTFLHFFFCFLSSPELQQ